jgi:ABC-type glutathione transport system ATPase component
MPGTGHRLEVRDLRKRFVLEGATNWWGRKSPSLTVHAVEGVSFSVNAGEVLTIVGESGCGKTTVAKMLVGLVQPGGGQIRVDGHELAGERSTAERRLIQLVSQNPWSALNRRRSIRHALEQPLLVHEPELGRSARTQRVEEMVERVGLATSHLDKRPRDVSGGELARAVLARTLLGGPKVIVLDEPTASLDASVKATVVNLLLDLRAELGLCLVLITHDISVARRLADKSSVMYLGRFVETGPARRCSNAPPTHTPECCWPACPGPSPARGSPRRRGTARCLRPSRRPVAARTTRAARTSVTNARASGRSCWRTERSPWHVTTPRRCRCRPWARRPPAPRWRPARVRRRRLRLPSPR